MLRALTRQSGPEGLLAQHGDQMCRRAFSVLFRGFLGLQGRGHVGTVAAWGELTEPHLTPSAFSGGATWWTRRHGGHYSATWATRRPPAGLFLPPPTPLPTADLQLQESGREQALGPPRTAGPWGLVLLVGEAPLRTGQPWPWRSEARAPRAKVLATVYPGTSCAAFCGEACFRQKEKAAGGCAVW